MRDKSVDWIAVIIVGTIVAMVLGTMLGIWVRLFWIGWVLRP